MVYQSSFIYQIMLISNQIFLRQYKFGDYTLQPAFELHVTGEIVINIFILLFCKSTFVIYRKKIYQDVFEYDYPLMNPEARVFQFIQPDENEYENQWKESFKQLVYSLEF